VRDEDLRTLEREALASGASAEARIRYADALERMGRAADAIEVLWPAIESPAVRERLAGSRSCASAAPKAPRLAFRRRSERTWYLGLTCWGAVARGNEDLVRLDPESGRIAARFEAETIGVARDVVVCRILTPEHVLIGCDLWNGRRLWRSPVDPAFDPMLTSFALLPSSIVGWQSARHFGVPVRAYIHDLRDPRKGPAGDRRSISGLPENAYIRYLGGGGPFIKAIIVDQGRTIWLLLRPSDGAVLYQSEGVEGPDPGYLVADERGWVISKTRDRIAAFDPTGKELWARSCPGDLTVGPRATASQTERDILLIDRATGRERQVALDATPRMATLGDDFVVANLADTRSLVAANLDGEILWRRSLDDILQPTADDHVTALVPYARSIFGLTASGTLFRLAP
jgi:hypothetical protein